MATDRARLHRPKILRPSFLSRAQTFFIVSVNLYHRERKRPALNVEHLFPNVADLKSPFAPVFERPTLWGCQCGCALGRVKSLRTLTLPCQETNPDGVICGGAVAEMGWQGFRHKVLKRRGGNKCYSLAISKVVGLHS